MPGNFGLSGGGGPTPNFVPVTDTTVTQVPCTAATFVSDELTTGDPNPGKPKFCLVTP